MARTDESFRDRLRKLTLAQWGLLCFFGGLFSGAASMIQPAKDRAELAGRGAAVLVFWIAGVVLIILHFVRRGQSKKNDRPRKGKATRTTRRQSN